MALQNDTTTLVCLFHHQDQAQAAIRDLDQAGIPDSAITLIGGPDSAVDNYEKTELASLGMPDKDYDHLKSGLRNGGYVVAVSSISSQVGTVEKIFGSHRAEKIDEADTTDRDFAAAPVAAPLATTDVVAEAAIPIVEEELQVGKRTVDQGGVRVYRRVVEVPAEATVQLREEHVNVNRIPVNREATDQDFTFGDRTVELTETAEEAVVGKSARVVEEVVVNKGATSRTETVTDTVRRTEVDVEEIPATGEAVRSTRDSY